MTMNRVFAKLRKYNKANYRQFLFCITFAILLVTSFGATVFSPTVQNTLDDGGDSLKLVGMIFAIAVVGCLMFSLYAAGLFFKYKSKETGVFLALGSSKRLLSKALYTEIMVIIFRCTVVGVILGMLVSFGIWQGFSYFFVGDERMKYQFSLAGLGIGLAFALAIVIIVIILAIRFMKQSNIMDIINDDRRGEPVGAITRRYGLSGMMFLVIGLILGYGVPVITGNVFHFLMPSIWNVVYLLVPLGLYRIIAYLISYNKRGRNPQKYYKKLISSSMMKFQGKQTVRNMLVIALLVGASMFALYYVPMNGFALLWKNADNPIDYALHYKLSMDEVGKEDIYALANAYDTQITDYDEVVFSELIGSSVERDYSDSGMLIEKYVDKHLFAEFVSESEYNRVMKRSASVPSGQYILLLQPEEVENVWKRFDDVNLITNPDTGETMPLSLGGTVVDHGLTRYESNRYILSDSDYAVITKGIAPQHQTRQILFNVADLKGSYSFAKALLQEYLDKAPPELGRMTHYDEYQHSLALEEGRDYSYAPLIELKWGNPALVGNWKYYPTMKIMMEKTFFKEFAVQFLLFIYVAIICLAAVGIIAYTRSISVGLSNKQLFEDLQKLGANKKYISKIITSQLNKLFVIPTALGSVLIIVFGLLMSFGNDGQFTSSELKVLGVNLIINLAVWVYMFIIYRFSLRKVKTIVGVK